MAPKHVAMFVSIRLLRANRCNEITEWLLWFAKITLQAQRQTILLVDFMIAKSTLLDWLRGQINERQQQALMRMFSEGPEGFKSGMTAGNYSTITGASPATTTRDLADLTSKGALIRTGERKHARYTLNLAGPTSTSGDFRLQPGEEQCKVPDSSRRTACMGHGGKAF